MTPEKEEKMLKSIQRMETALIGDKELGVEGLVDKVERNSKHRKRVNRAALLAGSSSVAGGASYPWWDSIKHFLGF